MADFIGDRMTRHKSYIGLCLVVSLSAAILFLSPAAEAGTVVVTNGWIRALPANAPAGGYFTLTNNSGKRIVLTGASSPACGMLMLHKTEMSGGMASMDDVEEVPVAPSAKVEFAPGGYHLMCMEPAAAIRPGNKVPVTLLFSDGFKLTSDFVVRNATGH